MNGQQFSSSGVSFTYRPAAAVSSVWPSRGAAEGGTPVTVLGSGFSASAEALGALLCRFNATAVVAMYVSEASIVCNTTVSAAGHALVEVSTNGREYTSSGVSFEIVDVVVSDVQPWSGPTLGGTVVTIVGSRLAHTDELLCSFGSVSVGASAHGVDDVRCVSPRFGATGWASLTLTSHGTTLRSGSSFYAHETLTVSAVYPPAGPVVGGTRVSVHGATFREASTMRCRFEASGTTVAARVISDHQLECAAPPSSGSGSRRLEVTCAASRPALGRRGGRASR